jgi:hypothetical protein
MPRSVIILLFAVAVLRGQESGVVIDYPQAGTLFPPDMAAPTFLWRGDGNDWSVQIRFRDVGAILTRRIAGNFMQPGPTDPRCVAPTNELPRLSPVQAVTRNWRPDPADWDEIKRHSAATLVFRDAAGASAQVNISISSDPVGAPIFYRDVPLMPSETEKGVIKPIVPSAVPLIAWRLRNVSESSSRLLMEGLPTCANCHSFSRDGGTLAMDVDGPQNDKGMYAVVPVASLTRIRTQDVFTWNDFPGKPPGQRTIGFMAQVSPDGQNVVATVNEDVYVNNFKDYRFLQVFYPTRGILVWYNRATRKIKPLPGADNPSFVQTNGFWSPDGKYLVFARAVAKDAYPKGSELAQSAGDPRETPIRYDLYRIPFNSGKGGRAEAIRGASRNGMSNSFPKVSPDGKWIVFVQSRNGQLMRPDGQLFIVPAAGGTARRMRANMSPMNSWHSFSPNGRWLVFSSKARSPYTQMYLTHIGEDGSDSPAVLIENATAPNRAVNIPEFANIAEGGFEKLEIPAADYYRLFDRAWGLSDKGDYRASVEEWRRALALNSDDPKGHNNYGRALAGLRDYDSAMVEWQKALELKPDYVEARNNLGVAFFQKGRYKEAADEFRRILAGHPEVAEASANLAKVQAAQRRK